MDLDFLQPIAGDLATLLTTVLIISLEIVGLVQVAKAWIKQEGKACLRTKIIISVAVCLIGSGVNVLLPKVWAYLFNTIALSLSVANIGYDIIAGAIPQALQYLTDKMAERPAAGRAK